MLNVLYYPVSAVMRFWYEIFGLVLDPAGGLTWALAVVFLVLTLRTVLLRPFLAQVRAGERMRAIAPQLADLRRRYRHDQQKLLAETQKLQREHGVSPLSGCLPILIQIPVFFALLHVLHSFNRPGLSFAQNATIPNYLFGPDAVRSFLQARLFGTPLSAYLSMPQQVLDSFGAPVQRWDVVAVVLPLLLVTAVTTHLTARMSLRRQAAAGPPAEPDGIAGQVAMTMRWMPWILPLGVLAGGLFFPFPVAILLYWLTNNLWTMVQQHLVTRAAEDGAAGPRRPGGAATRRRRE